MPLAVESGKNYPTVGLDIDVKRIGELNGGLDKTLEVTSKELKSSNYLSFTSRAGAFPLSFLVVMSLGVVPLPKEAGHAFCVEEHHVDVAGRLLSLYIGVDEADLDPSLFRGVI